jgi:putative FmdB family regulatory protein
MPIYEYRCENGHTFEVMQSMSDDPLTSCTTCNASVQRVFHPVAVHFKGSGFYTTDYGRKKSGAATSSDEAPKKEEKKTESKSSDKGSSD